MRRAKTDTDRKELIKHLPKQPGVYRMLGDNGELLYVGKAKNLKNRVSSYFQKNAQHTPKTVRLVSNIAAVDIIVTQNEHEAFILEDNLIKTHQPPYNILLKDDKRYPWLCITGENYPRVLITRQLKRRRKSIGLSRNDTTPFKARYYGPYTNVHALHQLVKLIRRHFPTRQRKAPLFPNRPCMNYSIGTCPGPCQKKISPEDYNETLRQIDMLLNGNTQALLKAIELEMTAASEALNFEWAAKLRDRHLAITQLLNQQQTVNLNDAEQHLDVIGMTLKDHLASFIIIRVRYGRVIDSQGFQSHLPAQTTREEAYETFLHQYYTQQEASQLPDALILEPAHVGHQRDWLCEWLTEQRQEIPEQTRLSNKTIQWNTPQRGKKRALLDLAQQNAIEALDHYKLEHQNALNRDPSKALHTLASVLNLTQPPRRIECYDISHVQGHQTVASMVVFVDGRPDKSQYRRFNIQQAEGKPDDFLSMREAMSRRFRHSERFSNKDSIQNPWPDPDLIIIDGGKGQLSSAVDTLTELGVTIPTVSLAKRLEEVFRPNNSQPLLLGRDEPALYLLQQLRDEAHRFAITSHRKRRGKAGVQSALDKVKGIGETRKKQLLNAFGSIKAIKNADIQALCDTGKLPLPLAENLYHTLHPPDTKYN